MHCIHCGSKVADGAVVCVGCGRPITPVVNRKPWYRTTFWLVMFFLFLTPVWAGIILNDPEQSTAVKVVAGGVLAFYVFFLCSLVYSA